MARVSGLEKNDAPWHLRWFYGAMRKMFGKDFTPAKIQMRVPGLVWGGIAMEAGLGRKRLVSLRYIQFGKIRAAARKTLARCGPALDRRNRIAVPHQSAQLECNVGFTVERHLHGHGISAGVLGDSNGNPHRLQGSGCRGNDQRACQPSRFCRTV